MEVELYFYSFLNRSERPRSRYGHGVLEHRSQRKVQVPRCLESIPECKPFYLPIFHPRPKYNDFTPLQRIETINCVEALGGDKKLDSKLNFICRPIYNHRDI